MSSRCSFYLLNVLLAMISFQIAQDNIYLAFAEDSPVWRQVTRHQAEVTKYFPEKMADIQNNPSPAAKKFDNFAGATDGGHIVNSKISGNLVGLLGNPFGQCPSARYVDCYCVNIRRPPVCVTRYYQAIQYRFPLTLAEAGSLFQSSLIPATIMQEYRQGLLQKFTPDFLKEVYRQNYIWLAEGMKNQEAPAYPPPYSEGTVQHIQEIARSFSNLPEEERFFAAWTSGQTPMIGYHAVPALLAREYAKMWAGAKDIFAGWKRPWEPWPRKICPGGLDEYNMEGARWTFPILRPPAHAYKVHQLKTSEMENPKKWFASEAYPNLAYIPQTPQQMQPYGRSPRTDAFTYEQDFTHRIRWRGRVHNLPNMSLNYFKNQARCYQMELGAGGYLQDAKFIPRVFPAHKLLSFADYDDENEPCLPYNLGPRIQFASNTQGPVFNAQHLGSVGPFMALAAAGYYAGQENPGEPMFAEENLASPFTDGSPGTFHDTYLFQEGNNIEGRKFTKECGSYAIPPLTGDYGNKEGYDKGLVLNNPNNVWIGAMWDWVRGVKRELTRADCNGGFEGGECSNFHYAY